MEEFTQEVLDEVQAELDAEIAKWDERNLHIGGWRMGDTELMVSIRVQTLIEVVRDHFGVSETELDIRLKRQLINALREMFPSVNEQRRAMLRQQITNGIIPPQIRPPEN